MGSCAKTVNRLLSNRGGRLGFVALATLLFSVACVTGESTFQEQPAEYFVFSTDASVVEGELTSWAQALPKGLATLDTPEVLHVDAVGQFSWVIPRAIQQDLLRAKVSRRAQTTQFLLDIDGRVTDERWCLNFASDFVAPRARVLRGGNVEAPELQASQELLTALPIFLDHSAMLRFDRVCLADGDDGNTRVMVALSHLLMTQRQADSAAYFAERELFATTGKLSASFITASRTEATRLVLRPAALRAFETHINAAAPALEFPRYERGIDVDGDGKPDYLDTCDLDENPDCLAGGFCGDGILQSGEVLDIAGLCSGVDCAPKLCNVATEACGWTARGFNEAAPKSAWLLRRGAEQRIVYQRADDTFMQSVDGGESELLDVLGRDAILVRQQAADALFVLPAVANPSVATLWSPEIGAVSVALHAAPAVGESVRCAAALPETVADTQHVVVGWWNAARAKVDMYVWRFEWVGGVMTPQSSGPIETDLDDCAWAIAPHEALIYMGHPAGVSTWTDDGVGWSETRQPWPEKRAQAAWVNGLLVVWNEVGSYTREGDGNFEALELCLTLDATTRIASRAVGETLLWAAAPDGSSEWTDVALVSVGGFDAWKTPSTRLRVNGSLGTLLEGGHGLWLNTAGSRSTLYQLPH